MGIFVLLDVIFFADDVLGVENALGLGGVVKAIVLLAEGNEVDNVGVAAIGAGGGEAAEVDRPEPVAESVPRPARSEGAVPNVPVGLAPGAEDDLLSADLGGLEHREGHGEAEEGGESFVEGGGSSGGGAGYQEGIHRGREDGLFDRGDEERWGV